MPGAKPDRPEAERQGTLSMRLTSRLSVALLCGLLLTVPACLKPTAKSSAGGPASATTGGKYVLVTTMTDDVSQPKCKAQAEDILNTNPDVACLIGLWAYNPPAILEAVRGSNKLGQVAIVGFDENEETLKGVKDGHIAGTIVQNPFEFGYRSIKYLAAVVRGNKDTLPKDGIDFVPHRVITKDNVEEFHTKLRDLKKAGDKPSGGEFKVAFVSNNAEEFWKIAERGCEKAARDFNVEVEFRMPANGTADEQRAILEDLLTKGVKGIAVSPNDSDNQGQFFDGIAAKVPLIATDNDLPKGSKRLCYVGTDNVAAGKAAGELAKKARPDGGKYVIFVGKLDAKNAQERRRGVIDVLGEGK
jgi:ribose transport system substrate-binding protein